MRNHPDTRFPAFFYLLTPFLALGLTFLLLEATLALWWPTPFAEEVNMAFDADLRTGFRPRPGSRGSFQNGISAIANSRGHRDDEVEQQRTEGVLRILILGDSFTVGKNVHQEDAYPQVLEALLAARFDAPIEVVNAGVSGWGPFQYAQYYETEGVALAPDAVIVGFFVGNDAYDSASRAEDLNTAVAGRRVSRKSASRPWIRLEVFAYQHSHLLRRLLNRGRVDNRDPRRVDCRDLSRRYLAIQRIRLANHLRTDQADDGGLGNALFQLERIRDITKSQGTAFLVLLIPDELQINEAVREILIPREERGLYDFDRPQIPLAERLDTLGIASLDLLPDFRADPRCLYMNDTHWNAEGHALAARLLVERLDSDWAPALHRPRDQAPKENPRSWLAADPICRPLRFGTDRGAQVPRSHPPALPQSQDDLSDLTRWKQP